MEMEQAVVNILLLVFDNFFMVRMFGNSKVILTLWFTCIYQSENLSHAHVTSRASLFNLQIVLLSVLNMKRGS